MCQKRFLQVTVMYLPICTASCKIFDALLLKMRSTNEGGVYMYLSNTTLFDGRYISSIYYIRYNYMFRHLTMAIFRLYMKYLVSSYMRLYTVER